jgi:hypothetical protein
MGGRDLAKLCGREGSGCSFRWIHDTPGSERGGKEKDYSTARRRREGGKGKESRNISWGLSVPLLPIVIETRDTLHS